MRLHRFFGVLSIGLLVLMMLAACGVPGTAAAKDKVTFQLKWVAQGQFAGLDQVNIGPLPRTLAGRGEVNLYVTVDGNRSNTVTPMDSSS